MLCALILVVLALAAVVGAHGVRDMQGPAAVAALSPGNDHHAGHHAVAGSVTDEPSEIGAVGAPVCRAVCLAVAIVIPPLDLSRRVSGGALLTALPDKALPRSRTRLPPLRPPMERA